MFIEKLLLHVMSRFSKNRTTSAAFHLISGRKSIQTMQDAHLFKLGQYYGTCSFLSRTTFDDFLLRLQKQGFIRIFQEEQQFAEVTIEGLAYIDKGDPDLFEALNGLAYSHLTNPFLCRILLFIQTISNSNVNHFTFIPVIDDQATQDWVRSFYKKIHHEENQVMDLFHQELVLLLELVPDKAAEMFVDRLTGYKHFGLSLSQLSSKYHFHELDIQFIFVCIIQCMIRNIKDQTDRFPIMNHFLTGLDKEIILSDSARKTYQFIQAGYTIEQIAVMRNLRENTIHDHIIEIAIQVSNFNIRPYISEYLEEEVYKTIEQTKSARLRDIKETIQTEITYFQIRLVLTKWTIDS